MKTRKSKRGGRRRGAGLKAGDPSGARQKKTVWLSPGEIAHCEAVGAGALSVGLQRLVAASMGSDENREGGTMKPVLLRYYCRGAPSEVVMGLLRQLETERKVPYEVADLSRNGQYDVENEKVFA